MNREAVKKARKATPIVKANLLSQLTFWWLKDLFRIGYKRPIEENDVYRVKDGLESDKNTHILYKYWNEELHKDNPSIMRAMYQLDGLKLILSGVIYSFVETGAKLVQPLCLGGLVSYYAPKQTEISSTDAYWYAFGIALSSAVMVFAYHPFILYIVTVAAKYRVGCSALIYRKSMKLSKLSAEDGLNSKVINLISNDLLKFETGLGLLHDIWKGLMQSALFGIVIYFEIGISAVIGMTFLISFIPLQAWIGKKSAEIRLRTAERTDFRIKVMNEIILGIQVIKIYAWEKSFAALVNKIRRKEINAIRYNSYIRAAIASFQVISKLSVFLSLASYIYFGEVITARKVFIVTCYFDILNISMVYYLPISLTSVAEAYVSAKRVEKFLLTSETKLNCDDNDENNVIKIVQNSISNGKKKSNRRDKLAANAKNDYKISNVDEQSSEKLLLSKRIVNKYSMTKGIILDNVTAIWTSNDNNHKNGIFNIDLEIQPGVLCAVVGPVGSGKSTLLNAVIGELDLDEGTITVDGTMSYAGQEPWLFEGSIRNNILFVEEYDEQRYNQVIHVCALERDFKLLPNGDQTIVGERGVSLSGGQRARVNLARAIYKQADIYLLDDPLSAVDAHVGQHIYSKCIRDYLKDKCCILVTHQIQYLPNIEHVVLMNAGRVEAQGSYRIVMQHTKGSILSLHATDEIDDQPMAETFEKRIKKNSSSLFEEDYEKNVLDRKEHQETGAVKLKIYKTFFAAVNSTCYVGIVFVVYIFSQVALSGADFFLSQWANWEEKIAAQGHASLTTNSTTSINLSDEYSLNGTKDMTTNLLTDTTSAAHDTEYANEITQKRNQLMLIYASIMAVCIIVCLYRSFAFFRLCLRISINLHDKMFRGITRTSMLFYNTNPSGRILNRFARDINNVDSVLPTILVDVIDFLLHFIAIIFLIGLIDYRLIIPTAIMILIFCLVQTIYVNTARSLKRIEALSRSPVFSHINATLQGLSTIRTFRAQKILENEFHNYQDHNTSAWYMFYCTTRGFALWLDLICVAYITFVTYSFLLFINDSKSGNVGLAILSSINLIDMCQWGLRQTAELENQMTSVERIVEYADLLPEPPLETDEKNKPPNDWPRAGNIAFKSLSLRYVENGERTLRDLTFNIEAKEKIGIVGRTGAGKSSIIQALFRLANNSGQILIDGIDISTLGLHDLRKNVSIIPQDPVLFSGKLRFNLDPFDEKKDVELWDALEQVELKSVVSSMAGALDCRMSDGGSNFSMGQRQLVCLARAILRNNKILILDEATANVDADTDKLIQKTIRTKFAECTVLTIAHRLHTVMDYDRVLVMDAGEVVEFDHPYELIQKPNGFFKSLVDQTGSNTSTALILAAKENYEKEKKEQ